MPQRPLGGSAAVDINAPLSELMTRPVVTVGEGVGVQEVLFLFEKFDIHHVPVVDQDGHIVGMVSANDFDRKQRWQPSQLASDNNHLRVRDIMSTPAISLSGQHNLLEAATLLNQHHFHCLPIVDKEQKVIGIITAHDLIRLAYAGS